MIRLSFIADLGWWAVGSPGAVVHPQTPYCASGRTLGQLAFEQIWST